MRCGHIKTGFHISLKQFRYGKIEQMPGAIIKTENNFPAISTKQVFIRNNICKRDSLIIVSLQIIEQLQK
jgi:hypothetical protein